MRQIIEIVAEKEGVSDDTYEIREILHENGTYVEEGEDILSYETSKTLVELEAPNNGYVYFPYKEDDEIKVGAVIAYISENQNFKIPQIQIEEGVIDNNKNKDSKVNIKSDFTDLANLLISKLEGLQYNLSKEVISSRDIIKEVVNNIFYLPYDCLLSRKRVVLIGAGGLTNMVIESTKLQGEYEIVGIVDSILDKGRDVSGVPILGDESILPNLLQMGVSHAVICFAALGRQKLRQDAYCRIEKLGFKFANIIHPLANIEKSAKLGCGNIILSQADIGTNVLIGSNCYINVGSRLCHDSVIGNNIHLAPGSIVAGRVKIGDNTLYGMGATCIPECNIGKNVIINNNVAITKDIMDGEHVKL